MFRGTPHGEKVGVVRMFAQTGLDDRHGPLGRGGHNEYLPETRACLVVVRPGVDRRLIRSGSLTQIATLLGDTSVEIQRLGGFRLDLQGVANLYARLVQIAFLQELLATFHVARISRGRATTTDHCKRCGRGNNRHTQPNRVHGEHEGSHVSLGTAGGSQLYARLVTIV
jgi:hypothetical protein